MTGRSKGLSRTRTHGTRVERLLETTMRMPIHASMRKHHTVPQGRGQDKGADPGGSCSGRWRTRSAVLRFILSACASHAAQRPWGVPYVRLIPQDSRLAIHRFAPACPQYGVSTAFWGWI